MFTRRVMHQICFPKSTLELLYFSVADSEIIKSVIIIIIDATVCLFFCLGMRLLKCYAPNKPNVFLFHHSSSFISCSNLWTIIKYIKQKLIWFNFTQFATKYFVSTQTSNGIIESVLIWILCNSIQRQKRMLSAELSIWPNKG